MIDLLVEKCLSSAKSIKDWLDEKQQDVEDDLGHFEDYLSESRAPKVTKFNKKAIVGSANGRIRAQRERFKVYKRAADSLGGQATRVEREYKKTINFTLIEIQELMNKLKDLGSSSQQSILKEIKDELDECCAILDSCLNSLEANHNIGHHHREENILCVEVRLFQGWGETPKIETKFIVGTPVDRDFRSQPRRHSQEA
jgi:hypothetical protein